MLTLVGCGGDQGAPGAAGAPGPAGSTAAGTPGVNGTPGTNGPGADGGGTTPTKPANVVTLPANTVTPSDASSAAWQAFKPQVTITSVTIAGPPVIKFTIKDAAGNLVAGLGSKSQSATATVASMPNLAFTLAKLVPGAGGEPSKWVSYNVIKPPTVAERTATPATSSCNAATNATWCGTYPSTDNQGALIDNGDGSYQYTFFRDVTQVAAIAATLIDSVNNLSKKADLGDLTYDAALTHRLGVQISGAAPGTGSNTPTGVTNVPGVNIADQVNFTYDFKPAGGAVTVTRDVVNIDTCASCHQGKGLAHGGRNNPRYCVTCHTDQVKYSFNLGTPIPMDANGNLTGGVTGSTQQKRAEQAILDGRAIGNFPNYIHKLHLGKGGAWGGANGNKGLVKTGYNYNADNGAMLFNSNEYPQDIRNCTVCHDGAAVGAKANKDGDNWKSVPSRLACGSCHDGIDFNTGNGKRIVNVLPNHQGGAQLDDKGCVNGACHTTAKTMLKHTQSLPPISDASKRTLTSTINSVAVSAADGSVTVSFTLKEGVTPVTDPAAFKGLSFTLAKLVPAVDGASSEWVSYTGRFRSKAPAQPPVPQGYAETALAANLAPVAATPGKWTYKFQLLNFVTPGDIRTGITDVINSSTIAPWSVASGGPTTYPYAITYQPTLTHRVAMMVQNAAGVDAKADAFLDFVPAGGNVTTTRNIVTTTNCTTCHADRKWHRGYNTELCVTCHNKGTFDPFTGNNPQTVDLQVMVHKLHKVGANYSVNGETFGSTSSTGGFPGELKNCKACHQEPNASAKDAANWRKFPNKETCGTCHDSSLATAHIDAQIFGGIQTCTLCHGPGGIADVQASHAK